MRMLAGACAALALLGAGAAAAAPAKAEVKRYVFVVLTNPAPGKEAEFNDWYTKVHLHDLVKLPGVVSAQRFVVAPENTNKGDHKYLAIYEVETSDLAAVNKALQAAAGTPAMVISPAMDSGSASAIYYQELTPKVWKPGYRPKR